MQEMGILTGGVIHKDEARISGGGLRRRFPSLAQQPFRREDSTQNGAERNPLPLGDLPDGMAFDEVLDQHEAVDRRDLTQRKMNEQLAKAIEEEIRLRELERRHG